MLVLLYTSKMEFLEFLTTETGKKLLIFNNYKFSFAHESQCGKNSLAILFIL
jgi:hypothetical protein